MKKLLLSTFTFLSLFSLSASESRINLTGTLGELYNIKFLESPRIAEHALECSISQEKLLSSQSSNDGVATVNPIGGSGTYTFLWDNGETSQTATNLSQGTHSVTVKDKDGCTTTCEIKILSVLSCEIKLLNSVSVYGGSDAKAEVSGIGGLAPYTFKWSNGSTAPVNENLSSGAYTVIISDNSGATCQCSITITEPDVIDEVCDGIDNDGDGEVDEGFDSDNDGVPDCDDICSGGDDNSDSDNDGTPDACDVEECDGVDNDGDGYIDEGFDSDGDGIADCFDKCPNGDDSVDADNDGIPDACDDDICIKPQMPQTECYETATWNPDTCSWDITGEQPEKPQTECYETAIWNPDTCSWDIKDGQPEKPEVECYQTVTWNSDTCSWDITGEQPEMPQTECYETATWNPNTCSWEVTGEQPEKPEVECYQTVTWNSDTCSWDITGEQPEMPQTECYETATWNPNTCSWDVTGEQPEKPEVECYQTVTWNSDTCSWDITGEQPEMPQTECYETATWNSNNCQWDIIQDEDRSCAGGSIDQCETAFARSSDSSTCFDDIPNFNAPRWGWTNEFPSIDGTYQMDLYAAAGQCDISKGALVGNVQVIFNNGSVDVTVSTLSGYIMTVAQLHVGTDPIPTNPNNGNLTVAPGQYAHKYEPGSDFTNYTFEDIGTGDSDTFYVILHANVCPMDEVAKRQTVSVELKGYPIPFKEDITIEVTSPGDTKGVLYMYGGLGQKVRDFGSHKLRKGKNEIALSVGDLSPGMYFIHCTSGYGTQILKVLNK